MDFRTKFFMVLFLVGIVAGCNKVTNQETGNRFPVSASTMSKEISGTLENSEESMKKPYVVLISIDGYRYDYSDKFEAENLQMFESKAEFMIPSFPSKTFPNHYTIVTGLYPGHHGLVSNSFYDTEKMQVYSIGDRSKVEDASWYLGTPLWVLAGQQHMVSASMFWVGSEAPIQGLYPTYYFKYDGSISHADRVNKVMQWLSLPEKNRPHFITLYFSITDSIGHQYGPDSEEIENAVDEIDNTIGDLMSKINSIGLDVNVIVVSDHGMLTIAEEEMVNISEYVNLDENIVTVNIPTMLYSNDELLVDSVYNSVVKDKRVHAYKKENIPESYHYSISTRTGDLIIVPIPPYYISSRATFPDKGASSHGWDPAESPEMGAIFYADGPDILTNPDISPFENIHIYPFVADILHLEYDKTAIDGDSRLTDLLHAEK